MSIKPKDLAIALLIIAVWGVNFAVIKVGLVGVPPLLLGALRFILAAFPALLLVRPARLPLRLYLLYGFTISVGQFALLFTAIHVGMPTGLASLVLQSQSFFTLMFAALWLGERWQVNQLMGLALAGLSALVASFGPVEATVATAAAPTAAVATAAPLPALAGLLDTTSSRASSPSTTAAEASGLLRTSGLVLPLAGMSMGISTGIGRGLESNNSGKPITPARTSTLAPMRRCRARRRMASMVGGCVGLGAPCPPDRNLNIRRNTWVGRAAPNVCARTQDWRCLAASRGVPLCNTPPTV